MKWIGQHIYDLVSRFRNDVIIESLDGSSTTLTANADENPLVIYQPVNNANPNIIMGSSLTESLRIRSFYQSDTQEFQEAVFSTVTAETDADRGRFKFVVDAVNTLYIDDGGIDLFTGKGISINGTDILTDSSGTATLSNIDALDATTISTLNAALTAGDITGVTAGDGLSGGGTAGTVTLNVEAAQPNITSLGTLTGLILDGDKSVTPGDGAMIHLDANEITDSNTSASGTAAKYTHVRLEPPRLHATNASVTTTDAATLHVSGPPSAGTNMTLTNQYALWVDDGDVRFDGGLNVTGATTLPNLTTIGATGVNTLISSNDVQMYNPVNDGNPQLSIGSSNNERLVIWPKYDSGAQTLDAVVIGTYTASGTANKGYLQFEVDEVEILEIDDGGINFLANKGISIAGTDILTDSSGTATLSNIDALDATTKTTIATTADAATASATGVVELATDAEAVTATDTARAVTPANLKARVSQIVNLKGYAVLQDDVYDFANSYNTDDEAPFQMDDSYGSGTIGSGTEVNQGKFFRSGGFHVPFACAVSALQTQITCNNAGNVSIALVEYRPSKLAADTTDYPRTVYETVVNASDDNNNKVDTVTIASGDLDNTAVPAGSHLMIMVKGDGTSVGGTLVVSVAVGLSW